MVLLPTSSSMRVGRYFYTHSCPLFSPGGLRTGIGSAFPLPASPSLVTFLPFVNDRIAQNAMRWPSGSHYHHYCMPEAAMQEGPHN